MNNKNITDVTNIVERKRGRPKLTTEEREAERERKRPAFLKKRKIKMVENGIEIEVPFVRDERTNIAALREKIYADGYCIIPNDKYPNVSAFETHNVIAQLEKLGKFFNIILYLYFYNFLFKKYF